MKFKVPSSTNTGPEGIVPPVLVTRVSSVSKGFQTDFLETDFMDLWLFNVHKEVHGLSRNWFLLLSPLWRLTCGV